MLAWFSLYYYTCLKDKEDHSLLLLVKLTVAAPEGLAASTVEMLITIKLQSDSLTKEHDSLNIYSIICDTLLIDFPF